MANLMLIFSLIALAASVALAVLHPPPGTKPAGKVGDLARTEPWVVYFVQQDDKIIPNCKGVLIPISDKGQATDIVATNKDCIQKLRLRYTTVLAGVDGSGDSSKRQVAQTKGWNTVAAHDVAIVVLSEKTPIKFDNPAISPLSWESYGHHLDAVVDGLSQHLDWVKQKASEMTSLWAFDNGKREPWSVYFVKEDGSVIPNCKGGALVPINDAEKKTDIVVTNKYCAGAVRPGHTTVVASAGSSEDSSNKQVAQTVKSVIASERSTAVIVLSEKTPIKFDSPAVQPLSWTSPANELDAVVENLSKEIDWVKQKITEHSSVAKQQ